MSQQDFGKAFLNHLAQAVEGKEQLDQNVVDDFRRLLPASRITQQEKLELALKLYGVLPAIQADLTPLTELITSLLDESPLDAILSIDPPVDLAAGLDVEAKPFHLLTLSILQKGSKDLADARRLATTQPEIFSSLVKLMLTVEDTAVAKICENVLKDLLLADREPISNGASVVDSTTLSSPAERAVWKRVFTDPGVYSIFYDATSLSGSSVAISKSRRTLAQARLLDFLKELADIDWNEWSGSHVPEVESHYGLQSGQGLLTYAILHMIAFKDDVLMHRNLLQFFTNILVAGSSINTVPAHSESSPALAFLIESGVHRRVIDLYTNPNSPAHDPLDTPFLYPAAGQYIEAYCTTNPRHFAASQSVHTAVFARLKEVLNMPISRWQHNPPESADVKVLMAIPPHMLLPSVNAETPLFYLPSRPATLESLVALAHILSGRRSSSDSTDLRLNSNTTDKAATRRLYLAYLDRNPHLWQEVIKAAEVVAMKDTALAAIGFIHLMTKADWPGYSDSADVPSSDMMSENGGPQTGIEALLSPPALTDVFHYLRRPPQTFSNLVGGRGDAESSAYQIATAKFDCTKAMLEKLSGWIKAGGPDLLRRRQDLIAIETALKNRIGEGILGTHSNVGGRVATMEL